MILGNLEFSKTIVPIPYTIKLTNKTLNAFQADVSLALSHIGQFVTISGTGIIEYEDQWTNVQNYTGFGNSFEAKLTKLTGIDPIINSGLGSFISLQENLIWTWSGTNEFTGILVIQPRGGNGTTDILATANISITVVDYPDFVFLPSSGDLQGYKFDGNTFNTSGGAIALAVDRPAITANSATRISYTNFISASDNTLHMYEYASADWAQVGNSTVTSSGGSTRLIAALSPTTIAHTGAGTGTDLKKFTFDDTDWAQTGNTLTPGTTVAMCGLSANRIASVISGSLRVFDFDGTDWTSAATALAMGSANAGYGICALSPSLIAIAQRETSGNVKKLRTFSLSGLTWTQVGNTFTALTDIARPSLSALSSTRIVMADNGVGSQLIAFDFDGTNWVAVGTPLAAVASATTGQSVASLVFRVF